MGASVFLDDVCVPDTIITQSDKPLRGTQYDWAGLRPVWVPLQFWCRAELVRARLTIPL